MSVPRQGNRALRAGGAPRRERAHQAEVVPTPSRQDIAKPQTGAAGIRNSTAPTTPGLSASLLQCYVLFVPLVNNPTYRDEPDHH